MPGRIDIIGADSQITLLTALYGSSAEAVLAHLNGLTVYANHAAEELLGAAGADSLLGRPIAAMLPAMQPGISLIRTVAGKATAASLIGPFGDGVSMPQAWIIQPASAPLSAPSECRQVPSGGGDDVHDAAYEHCHMLEQLPDAIAQVSAEGVYQYVNQAFSALTGLPRHQVIGQPVYMVEQTAGGLPGWNLAIKQAVRTTAPVHREHSVSTGDCNRVFDLQIIPRLDASGRVMYVLCAAQDVTDLRIAQGEYQAVFQSIASGIAVYEIICDAHGAPCNYRYLSVNPAFERLTGLRAHQTVGRLITELIPVPDSVWMDAYDRVARSGLPYSFAAYSPSLARHFDACVFPVLPGRIACTFNDITSGVQAIEALEHETERLSVTLECLVDGVVICNPQGRVTHLNRAASRLCECSAEEAINHRLCDVARLLDPDTRRPIIAHLDLPSSTTDSMGMRLLLQSRQGNERLVRVTTASITGQDGRAWGTVTAIRDVTLEERLQFDMNQAARMESISMLAGGIAHDFNNLLLGITGNLGLAQIQLTSGRIDPALAYVQAAEQAAAGASDLTRQLLTFAKGGQPVKQTCCLRDSLEQSMRLTLTGVSQTGELLADEIWPIEADAGQLAQVWNNLLINAIQAMPTGGKITVTATNVTLSSSDGLPLPAGAYVNIRVRDTGVGMPAEIIDRIFEPYFTTKQKGSGLGLASVYSIIRAHGGHIAVESELGKGTAFLIWLPASPDQAPVTQTPQRMASSVKGLHILIMDDEELLRRVLSDMLEALGHHPTATEDGEAAVQAYQQQLMDSTPYDLAIMDLTVRGGMGGADAALAIRDLNPKAVIAASSGYANDAIMSDPQRWGFNDILPKPYRLSDLKALLSRLFPT